MGRLALSLLVISTTGLLLLTAPASYAVGTTATTTVASSFACRTSQNNVTVTCNGVLTPNFPWPLAPVTVYAQNTGLALGVHANLSLQAYVLDQSQYNDLASTGRVTTALYNFSGSSILQRVVLQAKGAYYPVLYARAAASFNATISLAPPFIGVPFPSKPPAPTGIADYGIANESGSIIPYSELSNEVVGSAVVNSIKAFNQYPPIHMSQYAASLQMNVVLEANLTTGGSHTYWLQNVASFETNNQTLSFTDEIFNFSSSNSVLVGVRGSGGPPNTMGGYESGTFLPVRYAYPLKVTLTASVEQLGGTMLVRFGYSDPTAVHYYDNVTISEPQLSASGILVNGHHQAPNGAFYDAELVFAGGGSGASTNFVAMNSTLGMRYLLTNGTWASPRAVYSFGAVTGEGAYNLRTSMMNGTFFVTTGAPDFAVSYIESPMPQPPTTTTTATTLIPTKTAIANQSTTVSPTGTTTISQSSITPSGPPGQNFLGDFLKSIPNGAYIGAGIAIAGIAIAVAIARDRRRGAH